MEKFRDENQNESGIQGAFTQNPQRQGIKHVSPRGDQHRLSPAPAEDGSNVPGATNLIKVEKGTAKALGCWKMGEMVLHRGAGSRGKRGCGDNK